MIFLCLGAITPTYSQNINDCILRYAENDFGPFQPESLNSRVIGYAYISNPDIPDVFTYSNNNKFFYCEAHARTSEGIPVFKSKIEITYRREIILNNYSNMSVVQSSDGKVHLYYRGNDNKLWHAEFDKNTKNFTNSSSVSFPTPSTPGSLHAYFDSSNNLRITMAIRTASGASPSGDKRKNPFHHYDGAGIWLGKNADLCLYEIAYQGLMSSPGSSRLTTPTTKEILNACHATTSIFYDNSSTGDVIAGSRFGNLTYYKNIGGGTTKYQQGLTIVNLDGYTLRNPAINAAPLSYPNSAGEVCDLITAGEGGYYYLKFTGNFTNNGNPIYEDPTPLLYKNAELHGSTLPVPTIVDWDGDGLLDVVVGSSEGFIYLYLNKGTNENPVFKQQERLTADGEIIHIQPGYYEDIQGVGEARWGYVGPNVIDWNNDGYLDVLINDARGRHSVFLGSSQGLQDEHPLYVNDLELRGTWRCRPGVGSLSGQMVYITLDDQDELHLYKRIDNYNLEDAGKIKMTNGLNVIANNLECGGMGRLRVEIVDWDGDGVKDLILSTNKNASVPNPYNGMPWFQTGSAKGATVLFMRNEGSEEYPVYAYPRQLSYGGKPISLGHHACGAATGFLGPIHGNLPNILVFDELGRGFLLPRNNLSDSEIKISGVGVQINQHVNIKKLDHGQSLYSNHNNYLTNISSGLSSNYFTQWNKSELPDSFVVKASSHGNLYVASTAETFFDNQSGTNWEKLTTASFSIDQSVKFNIFTRAVKQNEKIVIPKRGEYGSILLSSDISFFCDDDVNELGVLIEEVLPSTGDYIPSSEIYKLDNGNYLGVYSIYSENNPITKIIRTSDYGESWNEIGTTDFVINPSLVEKLGVLFMVATDIQGNLIVKKSTNNGATWTKPINNYNGIVLTSNNEISYEKTSSPAIIFENRLWTIVKVIKKNNPTESALQLVSSSFYSTWDVASSWEAPSGSSLIYNKNWKNGTTAWGDAGLLVQGNQLKILAGVEGSFEDIGALIDVNKSNKTISFSSENGFINLPGGRTQFVLKSFNSNGCYLLSNIPSMQATKKLTLSNSFNGVEWSEVHVVLTSDLETNFGFNTTGWLLNENDFLALLPIKQKTCFENSGSITEANKLIFIKYEDVISSLEHIKSNNRITIYPNPATNHILVKGLSDENLPANFLVMDVLGYVLMSGQIITNDEIVQLNLNSGIYFMLIDGLKSKFIIQ